MTRSVKVRPPWPWERVKQPIQLNVYLDGQRIETLIDRHLVRNRRVAA